MRGAWPSSGELLGRRAQGTLVLFQNLQRTDEDVEGQFVIARARAERLEPGNAFALLGHDQPALRHVPHRSGEVGLQFGRESCRHGSIGGRPAASVFSWPTI